MNNFIFDLFILHKAAKIKAIETKTQAEMDQGTFELKGSMFSMTVMKLFNHTDSFVPELKATKEKAPLFFRQMPIIVDLRSIKTPADELDLQALIDCLKEQEFVPVGIKSATPELAKRAKKLGLGIFNPEKTQSLQKDEKTEAVPAPQNDLKSSAKANKKNSGPCKIIKTPIRSGQQVYAADCDIIALNTISHGSEIIADGSITVLGALRGRAMAGVRGDEAIISCHSLEAELVSINGVYLLAEQLEPYHKKNVVITLDGDNLQIKEL